tara:strand:+ start:1612 stop:2835 length:1224 start_codon:yes stop_codon:yes gene_type:complete
MAWENRITGEAVVDPATLTANPQNWRTHPKNQREALRGSLDSLGWVQRIIVNTETGHVVDGHARLEEAQAAGEQVPVLYVSLTEEEERQALATLDPISALAGANTEALTSLLAGVTIESDALRQVVEDLAPSAPVDGLTDPDAIPEVDEPLSALGDLWTLGDHRLLCGDATVAEDVERLMAGEEAALVFTDPPYGVDIQECDMVQAEVRGRRKDGKGVPNDDLTGDALVALLQRAFARAYETSEPGSNWYVCAPPGVDYRHPLNILAGLGVARHGIVWVKDRFVMGRADYHYRHENIIYGWKPGAAHHAVPTRDQDSVWEFKRPGRSPEHPTMKPEALVEYAIAQSSVSGVIVYDPFLGSGTTLIAAERLGRRCYGMEIEPKYVDVAVKRWEDFTGKEAVRDDRSGT